MYKAFSDHKNIDKMVRQIWVFIEEITLQVTLLPFQDHFGKNAGHWIKYVSTKSKNPYEIYLYWDIRTEDITIQRIVRKLLEDSSNFEKMEDYFLSSYKDLKKVTDKIYNNGIEYYKSRLNDELINIFKDLNNYWRHSLYAYYIPYDLVIVSTDLSKKEIRKNLPKYKKEEIDEIIKILSTTKINTLAKQEKISFLKKLIKIQKIYNKGKNWKDEIIKKVIFKQWYDFGSRMYTHKKNESYTLKDYDKKFFKNINFDATRELKDIKKEDQKDNKIIAGILSDFEKYPNIIKYISWLRKTMSYRNLEAEYSYIYGDHTICLFDEINKRLNLGNDKIWFLSEQEIIDGLNEKINAKKITDERIKKGYTIKQIGKEIKVFTGVNLEDWHEKEIKEDIRIFKGMPVYLGSVIGQAKIVIDPFDDNINFKKGEILVTSMTTPEFVPLMKRASAIITDEGGLLCHAAIVSREMKKPCIIGTKIATQVLKDGDLVEVDANNGIIKILNKVK